MRYVILESISILDLTFMVNEMIKKGFTPIGGVTTGATRTFLQALIGQEGSK